MNELQLEILITLHKRRGYGITTNSELSNLIQLSSIGIHQSCRYLERKKLILHHPPRDQFCSHDWSITQLGIELLKKEKLLID